MDLSHSKNAYGQHASFAHDCELCCGCMMPPQCIPSHRDQLIIDNWCCSEAAQQQPRFAHRGWARRATVTRRDVNSGPILLSAIGNLLVAAPGVPQPAQQPLACWPAIGHWPQLCVGGVMVCRLLWHVLLRARCALAAGAGNDRRGTSLQVTITLGELGQ